VLQTEFAEPEHPPDLYWPDLQTEQSLQTEFREPEQPPDLYWFAAPPPTAFPIITNFFQSFELFRLLVLPHL